MAFDGRKVQGKAETLANFCIMSDMHRSLPKRHKLNSSPSALLTTTGKRQTQAGN